MPKLHEYSLTVDPEDDDLERGRDSDEAEDDDLERGGDSGEAEVDDPEVEDDTRVEEGGDAESEDDNKRSEEDPEDRELDDQDPVKAEIDDEEGAPPIPVKHDKEDDEDDDDDDDQKTTVGKFVGGRKQVDEDKNSSSRGKIAAIVVVVCCFIIFLVLLAIFFRIPGGDSTTNFEPSDTDPPTPEPIPTSSPVPIPTSSPVPIPTSSPVPDQTAVPTSEDIPTSSPVVVLVPTDVPTSSPTRPPTDLPLFPTKSELQCDAIRNLPEVLGPNGNFDNNFLAPVNGPQDKCGDTFGDTEDGKPNRSKWSVSRGRRDCPEMDIRGVNEVCTRVKARLCTVEELDANVGQGTGCGGDRNFLWTNSLCDDGSGYKMYDFGFRDSKGDIICETDLTRKSVVRCCGDAVLA